MANNKIPMIKNGLVLNLNKISMILRSETDPSLNAPIFTERLANAFTTTAMIKSSYFIFKGNKENKYYKKSNPK